jgi:MFS family permease
MSTTPAAALPPFPYRELSLVVVAQLSYGLCWSTFLLLPKFMTLELGAGPIEIGLVSAIPGATAALAVPSVGRLIDRAGRRRLITAGAALAALTAFGFIAVDRIGPLLLFLQLTYGLSFVLAFNAAGTHVADLAPAARLSQVLGVFGASNVITNAIAPAIGEPLASAAGWQLVFACAGAMGLLAVALSLLIRDRPAPAGADASEGPGGGSIAVRRYALAMCAQGAGFAVAFAFYQPFALGLGMREVRDFFIGFALSVLLARVGLGSVPDRFGRKRVAVIALALFALAEIGMSRLAPGTLAFYGALLGLGHGFFYPAVNALAVEHSRRSERGKALTFLNGGFQVGYTVGVLAFGALAERTGYPAVFVLGGALVTVAAVTLARTDAPAPPPA